MLCALFPLPLGRGRMTWWCKIRCLDVVSLPTVLSGVRSIPRGLGAGLESTSGALSEDISLEGWRVKCRSRMGPSESAVLGFISIAARVCRVCLVFAVKGVCVLAGRL